MAEDELFRIYPDLRVSIQRIINKHSSRFSRYLSPAALFTEADLRQEGWMKWYEVRGQRFKGDKGTIEALFTSSLINHFNSILRYESRRSRNGHHNKQFDETKYCSERVPSPERVVMLLEAIEAITKVNSGLGKVFSEGIPDELLAQARRRNSINADKLGQNVVNYRVRISPRMLRKYFKISLNKLKQMANKYV